MVRAAFAEPEQRRGDVVAFPKAPNFGRARPREPFSLIVDLAAEPLGWRWLRGAATLALLCGCTLATAPGVDLPDFASSAPPAPAGQTLHYAALGADPAAVPQMPTEPDAPAKPRGVAVGERDGLKRVTGDVTDGLYWSLRGAGATQEIAAAYLQALATRIDVGEVAPYDRFDFVVDGKSGTPIVAAADGQVVGAGWNGGYGRQVVVAHGAGIATTYSHMSGFAAEPGMPVRQGQVIGYVGSSGLSTGPHLHFEVRVRGRAVDPLSVQLATRPAMSREQLAAIKARVKALTSIEVKKA